MAKLKDLIAKKGGGKLLTRDLIGKNCLITEDITPETDIRETDDGKYLAVQIQVDGEVQDWNPTAPQLRSVLEALRNPTNAKGKHFQITGSVKDGTKSKTMAVELIGDYAPELQTRLPVSPPSAPVPPSASSAAQGGSDLAVFLGAIQAQPGGHVCGDTAFDDLALLVCGGDITKANFMKGVAKAAGKIRNDGGCWSVTK